ncbi:MAG: hypothetical protein AB7F59_01940 [Bdellovibrionales bacterium]
MIKSPLIFMIALSFSFAFAKPSPVKRVPNQEEEIACDGNLGEQFVRVVYKEKTHFLVVGDLEPVMIYSNGPEKNCEQIHLFSNKNIIVIEYFKGLLGRDANIEETQLLVYKVTRTAAPLPANEIPAAKKEEKKSESESPPTPATKVSNGKVELIQTYDYLIKEVGKKSARYILKNTYTLKEEADHVSLELTDMTLGRNRKPKNNKTIYQLK